MTDPRDMTPAPNLARTAVVSGLVMFAVLQAMAAARAFWTFEYPLDDTYIHLAMASQIAHGGYGVNAGEYSSAASSALYPLLLTPFPDTAFQRYLPLLWNLAGYVLTLWLWGRALMWAGHRGWQGKVMALSVPILSGALTAAFTGMEHALQGAAMVAMMFGLIRFLVEEKLTPMLFLGLFFGPLLRFEDLALATMAVLILAVHGRWRAAGGGLILAYAPVLAFMGFLKSLGLGYLPNSVQAKLITASATDLTPFEKIFATLVYNMSLYGGQAVVGLIFAAVVIRVLSPALKDQRWSWLLLAMMAAGFGHLALAQTGWMERYEHYLIVSFTLAVAVMAGFAGERRNIASTIAVVALFAVGWFYVKMMAVYYINNPRLISGQQGQMAAYAQDHLNRNVAVNDLGHVSWSNPNYVLDLWGLASKEALETRLHDPEPGWAGPLTERHAVSVIMVYDDWIGDARDPAWVPLGKLIIKGARGFIGGDAVSFYARNHQEAAYANAALREWVPGLRADTCFVPMEATECPG